MLQVGFDHWRGNAVSSTSGEVMSLEGVDMLLFDDNLHITDVVQFTMQKYPVVEMDHN